MSLADKLNGPAPSSREEKLAEIERLLASNPGKLLRASQLPATPAVAPRTARQEAASEFFDNLERITCGDGTFLVAKSSVPVLIDQPHPRGYRFTPNPRSGAMPTSEELKIALRVLDCDEFDGLALEQFAFLDTETTGAAGGTGTLPFMTGLGFFEKDSDGQPHFMCEQYFVEDYCHEAALLSYLRDRLKPFEAFVTFNGKSFDVPMLRARTIINRERIDFERPHLDLLHVARRIWRRRIGGCSLIAVEEQILGIRRENDVPGRMVPMIFFDYLENIRRERMIGVFDHNAQDVISMGALMLLAMECAHDPDHGSVNCAEDLASLGRVHVKKGSIDYACRFLEQAVSLARDPNLINQALDDLATIYKKQKRYEDAAEIWRQECCRSGLRNCQAHIELLKLLEHKLKDLSGAMELIEAVEKEIPHYRGTMKSGLLIPEEFITEITTRKTRIRKRLDKVNQPDLTN